MATFLEGVGVIVQACTLVVGLPALALVLTARRGAPVVAVSTIGATGLLMWAKAAGHWTFEYRGWRSVILAVVVAAIFLAIFRRPDRRAVQVIGGVVGGTIAGWLWQPCVGPHLADILNNAGGSVPSQLNTAIRMVIYTAGALLPVALVAALPVAAPRTRGFFTHRRAALVGFGFGGIYAVALLSGKYDDLIGQLSRWSSA